MKQGNVKLMIVKPFEKLPFITGNSFLPVEVEATGFFTEIPGYYERNSVEDEDLFKISASEIERIGGRCYGEYTLASSSPTFGDVIPVSKWRTSDLNPFAHWNKIKASRQVGAA